MLYIQIHFYGTTSYRIAAAHNYPTADGDVKQQLEHGNGDEEEDAGHHLHGAEHHECNAERHVQTDFGGRCRAPVDAIAAAH